MTQTLPANGQKITDLRRVGINPDFWYPVAVSAAVRKEKTFAATFAGQRIAFIRRFTERVFAEDRMAVEAEQRAWDEQDQDRNHEVFPLILDLRDVLRSNGVPIRPDPACAATPCSGARR